MYCVYLAHSQAPTCLVSYQTCHVGFQADPGCLRHETRWVLKAKRVVHQDPAEGVAMKKGNLVRQLHVDSSGMNSVHCLKPDAPQDWPECAQL